MGIVIVIVFVIYTDSDDGPWFRLACITIPTIAHVLLCILNPHILCGSRSLGQNSSSIVKPIVDINPQDDIIDNIKDDLGLGSLDDGSFTDKWYFWLIIAIAICAFIVLVYFTLRGFKKYVIYRRKTVRMCIGCCSFIDKYIAVGWSGNLKQTVCMNNHAEARERNTSLRRIKARNIDITRCQTDCRRDWKEDW